MLKKTHLKLRCPSHARGKPVCRSVLDLDIKKEIAQDVITGELICVRCKANYPILGGVAILVNEVRPYLLAHVKGISRFVLDSEIPKVYLRDYLLAKRHTAKGLLEDDLESNRVTSLYFMNHYLNAKNSKESWWEPLYEKGSPFIEKLIQEYWDQGPFLRVQQWMKRLKQEEPMLEKNVVELGCSVGGLYRIIRDEIDSYLGLDQSFASIAIARQMNMNFGGAASLSVKVPGDLFLGVLSRELKIKTESKTHENADWIVSDFENPPLEKGNHQISIALNTIDMLENPRELPLCQWEFLARGGIAIQSCPYIWNEAVLKRLKAKIPVQIKSSAKWVESLYEDQGFKFLASEAHIPWLFFKNSRQLELYSVHAFMAKK